MIGTKKGPTSRLLANRPGSCSVSTNVNALIGPTPDNCLQPPRLFLIAFLCDPLKFLVAGIDLLCQFLHYFQHPLGVSPERSVQMSGVGLLQAVGIAGGQPLSERFTRPRTAFTVSVRSSTSCARTPIRSACASLPGASRAITAPGRHAPAAPATRHPRHRSSGCFPRSVSPAAHLPPPLHDPAAPADG